MDGVMRLAFDTTPIIYYIEANPEHDALITTVFEMVDSGVLTAVTSVVSLLEVLVLPMRQGNRTLQNEYQDLLLSSDHFETLPISVEVAERAADLRARFNLRTPDALQLATALSAGCEAILTNDSDWRRVTDIKVLVLSDLAV
ncbi:MAG: PIN domain-containing protein [Chloroflexota bacterium]